MKIVLVTVLVILVGMAAFLAFLLIDTKNDLSVTSNSLNEKINELSELQYKFDKIQAEVYQTTNDLSKTTDDLNATNKELNATKTELNTVIKEKNKLTSDIRSLNNELETANEEVDYLNNSLNLYKETFGAVYENVQPPVFLYDTQPPSWSFELPDTPTPERLVNLTSNSAAINPSYAELLGFLKADTTDDGRYLLDYYVCTNYAETVHNNAEAAGIRAALVTIFFETEPGHAINAFLTTDKGLVYIDCTGSSTAFKPDNMDSYVYDLKIGNEYQCSLLFEQYWEFIGERQIVREIEIYW